MYVLCYRRPDGNFRLTEPLPMHVVRDIMDMCDMLGNEILSVVSAEPTQSQTETPIVS